jgi:hypothetical protein
MLYSDQKYSLLLVTELDTVLRTYIVHSILHGSLGETPSLTIR